MATFARLRYWLRCRTKLKDARHAGRLPHLYVEPLERREVLTGLGVVPGLTDSASARFITGLYSDMLHRMPQPAEVSAWVPALVGSGSQGRVANLFTSSNEYRANLINDDYEVLLGRDPAAIENAGWVGQLQAGMTEEQATAAFLGANEYYSLKGASTTTWLTAVYQQVLGRAPDNAALADWSSKIQAGMSRSQAALYIVTSDEAHRVDVTTAYRTILGRDPDAGGLSAWATNMDHGMTPSQLSAGLAGSAEYVNGVTANLLIAPTPLNTLPADSWPLQFDFGSSTAPVAQRYLGVPLIAYAATRGYGWASLGGLRSNDRGTTDLVTRNFHSGTDGTFLVDLGNGTYNVTVTLGDARASHDDLAVWANGQLLASNVTTLPGQFLTASYSVTVSNGQLAVRIVDNGGRTRTFAIDALAISPAAPASQVFPNNTIVPSLPPPPGSVVNVSTVGQLVAAVAGLQTGQTIMVAAGAYQLTDTLYVPQGLSNVAIRGATGKSGDVVINGNGMSGTILFGIWVGNTKGITIADLTLDGFVDHGIILNAGAQAPLIHNVHMIDMGEQFAKSNPDGSGGGVNNGIVEYCTFEYLTNAPTYYTNGVDVHTGSGWLIRNNVFKNIRAVGVLAGPAILLWNACQNMTTEGNTFINCQREISYGLDPNKSNDNTGGIIRNNFIYRSGGQNGDVGINVLNSAGTEVSNNTVILNGDYANAIEYRFAVTTGVKILYNLTDSAIISRDGATATVTGNVTNATATWFVNEAIGDLHLTANATGAIGKAQYLAEVSNDYDGQSRPSSGPTDVGADEY